MFREASKKLEELSNLLSERYVDPAAEIMAYIHSIPEREGVGLTELAALPAFRGVHFAKIQKAAEFLAKEGLLTRKTDRRRGDVFFLKNPIKPGMEFEDDFGVWEVKRLAPGTVNTWEIHYKSRGKKGTIRGRVDDIVVDGSDLQKRYKRVK